MNLFEPLGAFLEHSSLGTLYAFVIPEMTRSDRIVIQSPQTTKEYARQNMTVTVEYSGPVNITREPTPLYFAYSENPVIESIQPTTLLAAGDIKLTVTGENMNVVENPTMEITTVIFNASTNSQGNSTTNENCSPVNSTVMNCLLPAGVVPEYFLQNTTTSRSNHLLRIRRQLNKYLDFASISNYLRSRRLKREPVANITHPTNGDTFVMYLGFIMDDLPTYENISKSLPEISFDLLTSNPIIVNTTIDQSVDFNPDEDESIFIYGQSFTAGSSRDDYTIYVGDQNCSIISLTDNEIVCKPPYNEPTSQPAPECTGGGHQVLVHVSAYSMHAYCLVYVKSTQNDALIIGLSVMIALIVLIIILIIAIIIVRRRRAKKMPKTVDPKEEEDDGASDHAGTVVDTVAVHEGGGAAPSAPELTTFGQPTVTVETHVAAGSRDLQPDDGHYPSTFASPVQDANVFGERALAVTEGSLHRGAVGNAYDQLEHIEGVQHVYEPNDPALAFDLKDLTFDESVLRIPRPDIKGRKQVYPDYNLFM